MADRLSVSKKVKKFIANVDESCYFGLGVNKTDRSDLFLFAASLALDSDTRVPLDSVEGLFLETAMSPLHRALFYSLIISESGLQDDVSDKDKVYSLVQQYANAGFLILENYVAEVEQVDLMWGLFADLDKVYDALFSS